MTRTALGISCTVIGVEPIASPSAWTGCGCRTASIVMPLRTVNVRRAVLLVPRPAHEPPDQAQVIWQSSRGQNVDVELLIVKILGRALRKCAVRDQNFGGADRHSPSINRQIEIASP